MKSELEEIIQKLERLQDLLYREEYGEAKTCAYEAQCTAIFLRDNVSE